MAILFNFIAGIGVGLIAGLIQFELLASIWGLANLLPGLGILVRRLRDAGKGWGWIFICLVPLVGWIILLVMLCKRSAPDNGVAVV